MFKDTLEDWLYERRCWSANLLFDTEIKTFEVLQKIRLPVFGEALSLHLEPIGQNVHVFSEISQQPQQRKNNYIDIHGSERMYPQDCCG